MSTESRTQHIPKLYLLTLWPFGLWCHVTINVSEKQHASVVVSILSFGDPIYFENEP